MIYLLHLDIWSSCQEHIAKNNEVKQGLAVLYALQMLLKFSATCTFLSAFPQLMIYSYLGVTSYFNILAQFLAIQNTVIFPKIK